MAIENLTKSILLIEDEQEIADIMMLHLSDLDYSVTHTGDGIDGLALALKQQWDLILLDLTLPGIDGIDICRQVRKSNPALPIILVSARSAEDERIHGLD
jgi:DNA-binding response OmpR family regulator